MMAVMPHTYLVDSSIYVFRAWFVLPDSLQDADGQPVNALLGFADFVYEFLLAQQPSRIAFAFDESLGKGTRQAIYPLYKANRPPAPESLKRQFQRCRELVRLLGLAEAASAEHEADDILATWARGEREQGQAVHVLSGDKDLTQLVQGEHDTWWDYSRNRRWGHRQIEKNWGVRPDQIADLLAIAGDKVDNIPGVPGIGATTAARLLRKFGTLEELLARRQEISAMKTRGAKRLQDLVCEHMDTIVLARQLTGLVEDVPDVAELSLQRAAVDQQALELFFEDNGFDEHRIRRWQHLLA